MLFHGSAAWSAEEEPVYRYSLSRVFDSGNGVCTFVMLNPSTADEKTNDPTVRRAMGYASRWGFRTLHVTNIFALRSRDPRKLDAEVEPVGAEDDLWIARRAEEADVVVCAWGCRGDHLGRGTRATELIREAGKQPMALRVTGSGQPQHPLYLPAGLEPFPFPLD